MPRISTEGTTDEEIEEWLGRLEETEALPSDYDTFQRMLKGELQMPDGSTLHYNENQIDALWAAKGISQSLADMGIKGVPRHTEWGIDWRYGIQGLPGLWNWESVQEIIAGEQE